MPPPRSCEAARWASCGRGSSLPSELHLERHHVVLVTLTETVYRHYMVEPYQVVPESPADTLGWTLAGQEGSGTECLTVSALTLSV